MQKTRKVTIQDIADALGISRNTVSKAINNSDGIAEATRDKILQKAVEMGYKQFSYVTSVAAVARQQEEVLEEQDTVGEIALFTTFYLPNNHFGSMMLDKFHLEISQIGFTMSIHRVTDDDIRNLRFPKTFNAETVKGILCLELFDYNYSKMLCSSGIPLLLVDGPSRFGGLKLDCDMLLMDNLSEVFGFTNRMISRGLTRIGFIGDFMHCQSFYERYMAFMTAMMMAGVPVDQNFVLTPPVGDDDAFANALESLNDYPDVFICANDFIAIDAMQILFQRNRSLMKKIRFFGFDDSHESRIFYPSLSTVHIHSQSMAYSAVQLLISRMKSPNMESRTVYVATDVVLRDSTEF